MMAKKTNILLVIIPIILVTLFILYQLGIVKDLTTLTTIPIESGKTNTNTPYSCPLSASECSVSATMNCDNPNIQQLITFRTNALNYNDYGYKDDTWIAINGVPTGDSFVLSSDLKGYCKYDYGVARIQLKDAPIVRVTPTGNKIYVYDGKIQMEYNRETIGVAYMEYRPCDNAELSVSPKSPYTQNGQEKIGDETIQTYNCLSNVTKLSSTGAIIGTPENLVYSSNIKGFKVSSTYTLKPGERLRISGGTSNFISYNSFFVTECDFNYCSTKTGENGYYKCDNGRKTTLFTPCGLGYQCLGGSNANAVCNKIPECSGTSNCNDAKTGYIDCNNGIKGSSHDCNTEAGEICGYFNSIAKCLPPFTTLTLSTSKTGYSKDESIVVYVNALSSTSRSDITTGSVKIYLSDKPDFSVIKGTYDINSFNFKDNEKKTLTIPPLDYGIYYIKMELSYNGKILKVSDKVSFKVNKKIVISMDVKSGIEGLSSLYIKNPVLIEVYSSDATKTDPVDADSVTLSVKLNGYEVSGIQTLPSTISGSAFIYSYQFTPLTKGNLDVVAYAMKGGVKSNTETLNREIKDLQIDVTAPSFLGLKCAKLGDTKTFNFETKVLDAFVDTTNKIEVIEPLNSYYIDISSTINKEDTGKYSFDYTFSKLGVYKFKLTSTSSKYNIGSEPLLPQIDVQDSCDTTQKECTMTEDCDDKYGLGYRCIDGKCVKKDDPLILYLIVIGVAIIVTIIIIIIVLSRRRNKDISMGGGLDL